MSPRFGERHLAVVDQGLNSVSNFALVAFAAIASTPAEFGRFAIAYSVVVFVLGAHRALVGETVLVLESAAEPTGDRRATITGASLLVAVPGAAVLAIVGALQPPAAQDVWFALAAGTFAAVVQDSVRYAALAENRAGLALAVDAVWTLPALVAMWLLSTTASGAAIIVLAWTAGAAASAAVGFALLRCVPRPLRGAAWLRHRRRSALRYGLEFASLNGSTLLVWVALGPLIGLAGVGALRGAQLLFSPLNTLFTALRIALIPELVRQTDAARFRRRVAELAAILGLSALLWGGAIMLMDDGIGAAVLGATWADAQSLRVPFFAQYLVLAGYTLILTVFRARRMDPSSSLMRTVLAVATLGAPLLLGAAAGATGAAWGLAVAVAAAVVVGSVSLARAR